MPRVEKVIAKGALAAGHEAPPSKPASSTDASGGARPGEIAETLLLKFDDRCRQQGFGFGSKGACIEFDFPEPPRLRTDDLLVLDDGRLAEVVADIEPVLELRAKDLAKDFAAMARLLVTLGNRHVPVQVLANRIRLQRRPEVEALLTAHGLKGTEIAVPFEPDDDAGHGHGHDHDHHGHAHDHGHGHDHGGHDHHHAHGQDHGHDHHHDEHGHGRHHPDE
jgi:urease accessory protein